MPGWGGRAAPIKSHTSALPQGKHGHPQCTLELSAYSMRYWAFPEGVQMRGTVMCPMQVTWAVPRTHAGARDGIQGQAPQRYLEGISAWDAPHCTDGRLEGALVARGWQVPQGRLQCTPHGWQRAAGWRVR